jgi:glycerol uptake facilitator-like aquaporin
MTARLSRQLVAESLGTAFLLMAVVGSGIMGERLAGGNIAVALLANTMATGAALVVLISIFAPVSGAHFNPAVTLYFVMCGEMRVPEATLYIAAQMLSAVIGVWIAHAMFGMPIFEISTKFRNGPAQWLSEFIATFGLIGTIACSVRFRPAAMPMLVGLYIMAAYWFTASTSFANPAVTLARAMSNSFAGIAPQSVPGFLAAQLAAAVVEMPFWRWLLSQSQANL